VPIYRQQVVIAIFAQQQQQILPNQTGRTRNHNPALWR